MDHDQPPDRGGGEGGQQGGTGRRFAPPLRFYSIMINAQPIRGEGNDAEQPLEGRSVVHIFFERNAFDDVNFRKASARAVRSLRRVPLSDVRSADKECTICYEPLTEWDGIERRPDPEEQDSGPNGAENNLDGEDSIDDHSPVEMPCGHIFGMSCLRKWLKTAKSCPLCRQKIESRAEYLHAHDSSSHNGEDGTPEPFHMEESQSPMDSGQMPQDFRALREMQWGTIRRQIQEMPEEQLPPVLRQFLARQQQSQDGQDSGQSPEQTGQNNGQNEEQNLPEGQARNAQSEERQTQDGGEEHRGEPEVEMQMPPPFLRGIIPVMVQQVREALERHGQPGFRFTPSPPSYSPASSTPSEQTPQQQENGTEGPESSDSAAADHFEDDQQQHPGDERRRGPERQGIRRRHPYTRPS